MRTQIYAYKRSYGKKGTGTFFLKMSFDPTSKIYFRKKRYLSPFFPIGVLFALLFLAAATDIKEERNSNADDKEQQHWSCPHHQIKRVSRWRNYRCSDEDHHYRDPGMFKEEFC